MPMHREVQFSPPLPLFVAGLSVACLPWNAPNARLVRHRNSHLRPPPQRPGQLSLPVSLPPEGELNADDVNATIFAASISGLNPSQDGSDCYARPDLAHIPKLTSPQTSPGAASEWSLHHALHDGVHLGVYGRVCYRILGLI